MHCGGHFPTVLRFPVKSTMRTHGNPAGIAKLDCGLAHAQKASPSSKDKSIGPVFRDCGWPQPGQSARIRGVVTTDASTRASAERESPRRGLHFNLHLRPQAHMTTFGPEDVLDRIFFCSPPLRCRRGGDDAFAIQKARRQGVIIAGGFIVVPKETRFEPKRRMMQEISRGELSHGTRVHFSTMRVRTVRKILTDIMVAALRGRLPFGATTSVLLHAANHTAGTADIQLEAPGRPGGWMFAGARCPRID